MLPPHTDLPMPDVQPNHGEWWPYENHIEFETADILFKWCQMSASKINDLLEIWAGDGNSPERRREGGWRTSGREHDRMMMK